MPATETDTAEIPTALQINPELAEHTLVLDIDAVVVSNLEALPEEEAVAFDMADIGLITAV